MARMVNVDGVEREMTASENSVWDADRVREAEEKPQKDWEKEMMVARAAMSDDMEEVWDAVGTDNATQKVKDAYDAKKEVRARQP